jgi:hypothetical protein
VTHTSLLQHAENRSNGLKATGVGARVAAKKRPQTHPAPSFRERHVPSAGHKNQGVTGCRQCGGEVVQPDRGRPRVFCSAECRDEWWREYQRAEYRAKHPAVELVCPDCSETFRATNGRTRCAGCYPEWRRVGRYVDRRRRAREAQAERAAVWRKEHIAALREQHRRGQQAARRRWKTSVA